MREKGKRALHTKQTYFPGLVLWSVWENNYFVFFVRTVYVSGMRTWPAADMRVCLQQPSLTVVGSSSGGPARRTRGLVAVKGTTQRSLPWL